MTITSQTIRTETASGRSPVDIYYDTLAKGHISCGGYIGPEVALPCEVGYTTTIIDDSYVGGLRTEIRVTAVLGDQVHIDGRRGQSGWERWNPLPRIERARTAQECTECHAPVGAGGHSRCPTHRAE